jgi:hypothetical protein
MNVMRWSHRATNIIIYGANCGGYNNSASESRLGRTWMMAKLKYAPSGDQTLVIHLVTELGLLAK